MTSEQIILRLQQEYARRREDNLHLFEERQEEACRKCPGLRELLSARHAAVMQGVRASILAPRKDPSSTRAYPGRMAELNAQIAEALEKGGFTQNFLQPVYTCAACRDEGYVYDPSRRMCDCMKNEYHRRLLLESGVAGDSCTFDRFDETLFSDEPDEKGRSQRRSAVIIRDVCQAYADSFPNTATRDLLLMGKSGLGKTFLLQCIAHRIHTAFNLRAHSKRSVRQMLHLAVRFVNVQHIHPAKHAMICALSSAFREKSRLIQRHSIASFFFFAAGHNRRKGQQFGILIV